MLWGPSALAAPYGPAQVAHTVTPASTNLTAVLGVFARGPINEAVLVTSWREFVAIFGGRDPDLPFGAQPSMAVYALWQFFANGGVGAWVVRLDAPSSAIAHVTINPLTLRADGPGTWANGLLVEVQPSAGAKPLVGAAARTPDRVDFVVSSPTPGDQPVVREVISGLRADARDALSSAINTSSFYVTATAPGGTVTPDAQPFASAGVTVGGLTLTTATAWAPEAGLAATIRPSSEGAGLVDLILTSAPCVVLETLPNLPSDNTAAGWASVVTQESSYLSATPAGTQTGPLLPQVQALSAGADAAWSIGDLMTAVLAQVGAPEASSAPAPAPALDRIAPALFNIMCIPDVVFMSTDDQDAIFTAAHRFCKARRALLIVDPPPPAAATAAAWLPGADTVPVGDAGTPDGLKGLLDWAAPFVGPGNDAAAAYYPWVQIADPWNNFVARYVPPSGSVAGVYAATDAARAVWKSPAGTTAKLSGVTGLADLTLDDTANGILNAQGINCLRTFAGYGNVIWGARTLAGDALYASQFRYVATRRLADFVAQSLHQSMQWAVFEPNGPPLWAALTAEATVFMNELFAQGAFGATTAAQAFTVSCDATTATVADRQAGLVNVNVAFQPSTPAGFVALTITLQASAPVAG